MGDLDLDVRMDIFFTHFAHYMEGLDNPLRGLIYRRVEDRVMDVLYAYIG